jgi:hypothetical protein
VQLLAIMESTPVVKPAEQNPEKTPERTSDKTAKPARA